ncbi:unnamed protein product [Boreogadus saida]
MRDFCWELTASEQNRLTELKTGYLWGSLLLLVMTGSVLGPAQGRADSHGKNAGLIRGDKAAHCGSGRSGGVGPRGPGQQELFPSWPARRWAMGGWEMSQQPGREFAGF